MSETQHVFSDVKVLHVNGAGYVSIGSNGDIHGNISSSEFHPGTGELFIVSSAREIREKNAAPTFVVQNGVVELKIPRGFKLKVNGGFVENFIPARPLESFQIINSKICQIQCEESVNVTIHSIHVVDKQCLSVETRQTSGLSLPNTAFFKKLSIHTHDQSKVLGSRNYLGRMSGAEILSVRAEGHSSIKDLVATQSFQLHADPLSGISVSHFKNVDTKPFVEYSNINLAMETNQHLYEDVVPQKPKTRPLPPKKKKRTQE